MAQRGGVRAPFFASCGSRRLIWTSCACRAIDSPSVDSCSTPVKRARTPAHPTGFWRKAKWSSATPVSDTATTATHRRQDSSSSRTSTCSLKTYSARTSSACKRNRPPALQVRLTCARAFVTHHFHGLRTFRAGRARSMVRLTTLTWLHSRRRSTCRSRSIAHRALYAAG